MKKEAKKQKSGKQTELQNYSSNKEKHEVGRSSKSSSSGESRSSNEIEDLFSTDSTESISSLEDEKSEIENYSDVSTYNNSSVGEEISIDEVYLQSYVKKVGDDISKMKSD
eukprot:CAMPEP_0178965584 /NCGR_PEP_ID=MMETSP0789-20121207/16396_1 /TAXON_ID=3005 /ORGANISM="Rhizosolenia setigera, Strain CCMP 1694" /LENGTH=110 /DNA_ID=CAMNT_0020650651 /DNA_START=426 /DNA_END=758 /DNA_ORIENTATION=-